MRKIAPNGMTTRGQSRSIRKRSLLSTDEIENAPMSTPISFANSAGWKLNGPRAIHRCAPLTVVPTKSTATRRKSVTASPMNISPRSR